MPILHEDGALDRTDFVAARVGRGAIAGPPSGRATWTEAGGAADGAPVPAWRGNKLRGSTSGGGCGARNLVGAAVRVGRVAARHDAGSRCRLQVGRRAARLRQPDLRIAKSA